jgi:hypothetical protein
MDVFLEFRDDATSIILGGMRCETLRVFDCFVPVVALLRAGGGG